MITYYICELWNDGWKVVARFRFQQEAFDWFNSPIRNNRARKITAPDGRIWCVKNP